MSTFKLVCAELRHRKMNAVLSLLALVAAAALMVASPTLLQGYGHESQRRLDALREETATALTAMQRETNRELERMQADAAESLANLEKRTRRTMRDLGFNLRIVHRNTDLNKLYTEFVAFEMPESYVTRLAESPQITKIVHLVASLKQMIVWRDKSQLLVGLAREATQSHIEQKAPMGYQIERGHVFLGQLAGEGVAVGASITILDRDFTVDRILPLAGSDEDIAIYMNLKDAQELLDKPGQISEILALGCKCETTDRVEEITAQLETVLPEARVTELRLQAIARDKQRKLVENYHAQAIADYRQRRQSIVEREAESRRGILDKARQQRQEMMRLLGAVTSVVTPLIVLVCAAWVGLLAWSNVHERRREIGLLRALGKRSSTVATMLLGKAALIGLCGGVAGCWIGYHLARWLATGILDLQAAHFTPAWFTLLATLLGTPLVAAAASYLPTLAAIRQDPAAVLME